MQVLANLVSGEGSLPGLQTATLLLCPHLALPWCVLEGRERARALSCLFSQGHNPVRSGPTLTISLNRNYFLAPNTATLGVTTSTYEL